jgi:hypothetical protein
LNIKKRRLNDICNILEANEIIRKVGKNQYMLWNQAEHEARLINYLDERINDEDLLSERLDSLIYQTSMALENLCENENLYLDGEDVENIADLYKDNTCFLVEADKGVEMEYNI